MTDENAIPGIEVDDSISLPPPPPEFGAPYVMAAFLCERLLREEDQTISAIRLVENVTIRSQIPFVMTQATLTTFLEDGPPIVSGELTLAVLIRGRSGPEPHRFQLALHQEGEGRRGLGHAEFWLPVTADSENPVSGNNLFLTVPLSSKLETGLLWYEIYIDGAFASRVPFHVEQFFRVPQVPDSEESGADGPVPQPNDPAEADGDHRSGLSDPSPSPS